VDNHVHAGRYGDDLVSVAYVAADELEGVRTELRLEPRDIRRRAAAREIVVDRHGLSSPDKTVDVVRADESGAARDQIVHTMCLRRVPT